MQKGRTEVPACIGTEGKRLVFCGSDGAKAHHEPTGDISISIKTEK